VPSRSGSPPASAKALLPRRGIAGDGQADRDVIDVGALARVQAVRVQAVEHEQPAVVQLRPVGAQPRERRGARRAQVGVGRPRGHDADLERVERQDGGRMAGDGEGGGEGHEEPMRPGGVG
jgi:hypothetical protein